MSPALIFTESICAWLKSSFWVISASSASFIGSRSEVYPSARRWAVSCRAYSATSEWRMDEEPYDGDHLVEHHLLFLRERPGPGNEQGESRPQHTFFQHYSFSLSFVFSFSKIFMLPPSHARL